MDSNSACCGLITKVKFTEVSSPFIDPRPQRSTKLLVSSLHNLRAQTLQEDVVPPAAVQRRARGVHVPSLRGEMFGGGAEDYVSS